MRERLDNLPSSYVVAAILIAVAVAALAIYLASRGGEAPASVETIAGQAPDKPKQVVEAFFLEMSEGDCDQAISLLHIDELRNASLKVEVAIRNTATSSEIQALGDELRSMDAVESVYLVSSEEALARMRQTLGEDSFAMAGLAADPPPAFYEVTLSDPAGVREVTARFYENQAVDASRFSAPVSIRDQVLSSCRLLVDRYDYQVKDFSVITERYVYDDSFVSFTAVALIDGVSGTPGEFEFMLKETDDRWKIDYFSSLANINGTFAGFFSLVLVNNPEMAEKIDSLDTDQSQMESSTPRPAPGA